MNLTNPTCILKYNCSTTISKTACFVNSLIDIKKDWNILRMRGRYFIREILKNLNIYIYTAAYIIFRSHFKIIRPINNDKQTFSNYRKSKDGFFFLFYDGVQR